MGEMADYFIEQQLSRGWSPVSPRYKGNQHDVTCSRCGAKNLKWRETENGWRLFEDKRGDRNQKLEHQCGTATESDFEVLDGN